MGVDKQELSKVQNNYDEVMINEYKAMVNDKSLVINYNQKLKSFSFVDELDIIKLSIYVCPNITFEKLPQRLEQLVIYNSKIQQISWLSKINQISHLTIYNNNVKDLQPLSNLPHIQYLDMITNNILDISPLSKLQKLKELYLSYNRIIDISPLLQLKLNVLWIAGNQIQDFSQLTSIYDQSVLSGFRLDGQKQLSKSDQKEYSNLQAIQHSMQQNVSIVKRQSHFRKLSQISLNSINIQLSDVAKKISKMFQSTESFFNQYQEVDQ
ncbi:leucine-rich_repeat domain-containing protein brachy] [Hexamita inflata]|uniref:Leucine-rich repeat domain-containing protein brachy] n=1 Tax=Hexamita inflata TaxID=28002 RepID=A0AA86VMP1_9EUKA|nr:leucine-rich repeat domain-containing protein brachy] [Hexamita inflata]